MPFQKSIDGEKIKNRGTGKRNGIGKNQAAALNPVQCVHGTACQQVINEVLFLPVSHAYSLIILSSPTARRNSPLSY